MGPLVSKEQLERVSSYIDQGESDGATIVTGGDRIGNARPFTQPHETGPANRPDHIHDEQTCRRTGRLFTGEDRKLSTYPRNDVIDPKRTWQARLLDHLIWVGVARGLPSSSAGNGACLDWPGQLEAA